MKRMAYGLVVLALAGLVLVVSGCKEPRESEAEVRKLVEETGSLKAQNRTLEQEQNRLESEVSSLKSENNTLKEQLAAGSSVVTGLKEEIERLKVGGVAAVRAVAEAAVAEAAARQTAVPAAPEAPEAPEAPAVPSADEPRREGENRTPGITKAVADLELRKTNLRAQIGAGQTEVSALTRTTIDTRMAVPTGCFVDGQNIYRKRLICGHPETAKSPYRWDVYAHHHTDSCYTSDLIGPAVKEGDFRTQHDKDMAIEAAKAKILPLFEEMRALDKELDRLQKELAELRKEKTSEAKTPEEAPGTVLKHKETGETIKGTLTKQKINNLTVFKLADGGTKLINTDEWKTLEAAAEVPPDEKQKEDGR